MTLRPIPHLNLARIMNDDAMIAAYADDRPDLNELLRDRASSDLHWPSIVLGVLVFGLGIVAWVAL